jgi:mannose-6-phosphate isomerase-like protein (cupin superfamily)
MAQITQFKGYSGGKEPTIPKPDHPVFPNIVTVQEGVPVAYPNCHGLGVRVVHPVNKKAPGKNLGLVMFYLPPHVTLPVGSHETEETYVVLEGRGLMTFAEDRTQEVEKGTFVHLPPWCEHGIENTGNENLVVLIATSPPNP